MNYKAAVIMFSILIIGCSTARITGNSPQKEVEYPYLNIEWMKAMTSTDRIRVLFSWNDTKIKSGDPAPHVYLSRKYIVGKPVSEVEQLLGIPDLVKDSGGLRLHYYVCNDELDSAVGAQRSPFYDDMRNMFLALGATNFTAYYTLAVDGDRVKGYEMKVVQFPVTK